MKEYWVKIFQKGRVQTRHTYYATSSADALRQAWHDFPWADKITAQIV